MKHRTKTVIKTRIWRESGKRGSGEEKLKRPAKNDEINSHSLFYMRLHVAYI